MSASDDPDPRQRPLGQRSAPVFVTPPSSCRERALPGRGTHDALPLCLNAPAGCNDPPQHHRCRQRSEVHAHPRRPRSTGRTRLGTPEGRSGQLIAPGRRSNRTVAFASAVEAAAGTARRALDRAQAHVDRQLPQQAASPLVRMTPHQLTCNTPHSNGAETGHAADLEAQASCLQLHRRGPAGVGASSRGRHVAPHRVLDHPNCLRARFNRATEDVNAAIDGSTDEADASVAARTCLPTGRNYPRIGFIV